MLPMLLATLLQVSAGPSDESCYGAATTQSAMNQCAGAALKVADARLDEFLSTYADRLSPEQRELLHTAQSDWQQFRESSCKFKASGVRGGSAYRMVLAQCLASQAEARLLEMKLIASCQEGDLSCPSYSRGAPHNSFKANLIGG
ncbi:lysozyme inhibitor LprI family protein [Stutzerimonas stutzeri]|uniref:lysozyme inhibitor LprI family protein n=1 Tax=Stutzerimonas stutzeri TaxID=316 RepID=UPI000373AB0D